MRHPDPVRPRRRCRRATWIAAAAVTAIAAAHVGHAHAVDLPALGADPQRTSVSGISSGAYMAGQYQIAHSAGVIGAAIVAGGPYGCAEARFGSFQLPPVRLTMNASQSLYGCMLDRLGPYGIPDVPGLADLARDLAAARRIDSLDNLAQHKVYIFSGGNDTVVKPRMAVLTAELYLRLGVPRSSIATAHLDGAGHGFVTVRETANACGLSKPPYVVRCGDYDQARSLLSLFYALDRPRVERPMGDLVLFDQRPFTADLGGAGMSDQGMVFVPEDCRTRPGCAIHVAFHGCRQNRAAAGDAFVSNTGYVNWADDNRLIVLFPDAAAERVVNPLGCWDWWGYTGFDYLTRDAPQIAAVRRMVERLTARP